MASRVGSAQARVAARLLLTLRGTPTIYYGDEIGMHDVKIPPEQARDPVEKAFPYRAFGRDAGRTPMQWNAKRNAGFSSARPWLPVADDSEQVNVEKQKQDERAGERVDHRIRLGPNEGFIARINPPAA